MQTGRELQSRIQGLEQTAVPAREQLSAGWRDATTSVLAPADAACAGDISGKPISTALSPNRSCPTQASGVQSRNPNAVLALLGFSVSPINNKYGFLVL
jgi:hypothetical protein